MNYRHVCIESLGFTLPDEIWTSDDVESRLEPLYSRLKLPAGRLELMTGIRERRFWPADVRPSQLSIASCRHAIQAAEIDPAKIGCLIHGSVCRDFLEPATACTVHHHLGLRQDAVIYDVSNACLGKHIKNVIKEGELRSKATVSKMEIVQSEGKRKISRTIEIYNLDMIISVGYRINSSRATQFRIWATQRLKDYLVKGYAINKKRLDQLQKVVEVIQQSGSTENIR